LGQGRVGGMGMGVVHINHPNHITHNKLHNA
jgi:hypothetical protein